jgi:hypothetical protein
MHAISSGIETVPIAAYEIASMRANTLLLNVALTASLQGDLLEFLEKIALDDHMHS